MVVDGRTSSSRQTGTVPRDNSSTNLGGASASSASVEDKLASLSYSFSQHMPAPRKKKSPFEQNFPELNSGEGIGADVKARDGGRKPWERMVTSENIPARKAGIPRSTVKTPVTAVPRSSLKPSISPSYRGNGSVNTARIATAAEIVAHRKESKPEAAPVRGPNAELELFSKLVPTTSSVPRTAKGTTPSQAHSISGFSDSAKNIRRDSRGKQILTPMPESTNSSGIPSSGARTPRYVFPHTLMAHAK